MTVNLALPPARPELALAVERQIEQRTWGRVHRLTVEALPGRVIVRGCTPSYYVKQLAIQAALEALGAPDAPALEVVLEVGEPRPTPGRPGTLVRT